MAINCNLKRICIIMLCLSISLFLIAGEALANVSAPQKLTSFTRITQESNLHTDTYFSVSKGKVLYTDWNGTDYDIYNYDVAQGTTTQIPLPGDQVQAYVYGGNSVVWKDWSAGYPQLYHYNLATHQKTYLADIYLTPNPTSHTSNRGPKIFSNIVVWEDYRNGNWDVYSYNLITQELKQITNTTAQEGNPSVNRGKIVYHKYSSTTNYDTYLYDLANDQTTTICVEPGKQVSQHISKDYVVWADARNNPTTSDYDIGYYNLNTAEQGFIPLNGKATSPKVFGDQMVYADDSSGSSAIYLYNLTTKTSELVSENGEHPLIYQNEIYWLQETSPNSWDIYMSAITADETNPTNLNLQTTVLGQEAIYFAPSLFSPVQATLSGMDGVKASYTVTLPWLIQDARGTGAGWYATLSVDGLTGLDNKTISNANLYLTVTQVTKALNAQTSSDPSMLQGASNVSLVAPATLISAPVNQGMGSFNFNPTLEVSLPASSYAGEYSSSVYVSMYENAPTL